MIYYSNMKEDILKAVKDELDTATIMVTSDSGVSERKQKFPKELINRPVLLKNVIDYFDYDFDSGYGSQECHDFYIWTTTKVFFIHEYDGSTHITWVPRNPVSKKIEEWVDITRNVVTNIEDSYLECLCPECTKKHFCKYMKDISNRTILISFNKEETENEKIN